MTKLNLTQGQTTTVDKADAVWLSEWKWHAVWMPSTRTFYAERKTPRPELRHLPMHTAIWEHHRGPAASGFTIDHTDRDSLNNRLSNLRLATRSQQTQNQRVRSDNASGYRGVSLHTASRKWRAQIMVGGRQIGLGYFDDPASAAEAYDTAARTHHGEFAQVNFP